MPRFLQNMHLCTTCPSVLRVGGPGSSRSWLLLYANGTQHPALEKEAMRSQPTACVQPKPEAFLFFSVPGDCCYPSFSASSDCFWLPYGFPKLQLAGPHRLLPAFPFRASVPHLGCTRSPLASLGSSGILALAMQYPASGFQLGSQPYLKLSALPCPVFSYSICDTFPHNHYSWLKLPECVSCFFGVFFPNTPETTRVLGAMFTCLTLHPT